MILTATANNKTADGLVCELSVRDGDCAGLLRPPGAFETCRLPRASCSDAIWKSYCYRTRRTVVNFLQGVYRFIATPDDDADETDDDAPPTTLRTKLAMAAITFLSAFVATVTLQGCRRRKRSKDV